MRKILASAAIAAAAFAVPAPADASGCYGVHDYATACYSGGIRPTLEEEPFCVYTGGSTCETYYVPVPGWEGRIGDVQVCVLGTLCTAN